MGNIAKFNKEGLIDRVLHSYLKDEDEDFSLTPKEEIMKNRMRQAYSHLMNMYSKSQTAKLLVETHGYSLPTAYKDIDNAMQLYGSLHEVDAKGEKMRLKESYWRLYQCCLKEKDWDGARKNLDSYRMLIEGEMNSAIDIEKLEANQYNITIPSSVSDVLLDKISKGAVNLNSRPGEDLNAIVIDDED